MPIFLHRACIDQGNQGGFRNQLYEIEIENGGEIRVRDLPEINDLFINSSLFVEGSRVFLVGRSSYSEGGAFGGAEDGIFYCDYNKNEGRWDFTSFADFKFQDGMAVLGDEIHCFGEEGKNFCFSAKDVKPRVSSFKTPPRCETWFPFTVAVTTVGHKRIYVFWTFGNGGEELGYYDEAGEWHTIDSAPVWAHPKVPGMAVPFKDKYLIAFANFHPVTEKHGFDLYACDISKGCRWLDEPVEVRPLRDAQAFPLVDDLPHPCFESMSMVQVSPNEFALIWSPHQTNTPFKLCCTKFELSIQHEDTDSPTLTAHLLSSTTYTYRGRTAALNCTSPNLL